MNSPNENTEAPKALSPEEMSPEQIKFQLDFYKKLQKQANKKIKAEKSVIYYKGYFIDNFYKETALYEDIDYFVFEEDDYKLYLKNKSKMN